MNRESTVHEPSRKRRRLVVAALAAACALASVAGTASAGSGAPTAVQAVEGQAFAGTVATYTSSATADRSIVEQAYVDLLGRNAGQSELTTFAAFLGNGGTPGTQVASALLASDEGRTAIVRSAYAAYLDRPADDVGLAAGLAFLKTGATDEQLKALLLRIGRVLHSTRGATVPALPLGAVRGRARPPDRRGGRGRLRAGDRGRRDPPGRGARSPRLGRGEEGARQERSPRVCCTVGRTPAELQAFVDLLGNGGTDEQMTSAIVGLGRVPGGASPPRSRRRRSTGATARRPRPRRSLPAARSTDPTRTRTRRELRDHGGRPRPRRRGHDRGHRERSQTPRSSAAPSSLTVARKTPFTRTVATFTDANPSADASEFSASIHWGDGEVSAGHGQKRSAAAASPSTAATPTGRRAPTGSRFTSGDEGGSTADAVGTVLVTKKG